MSRRFVRDINERPESPIDEFGGPGEAVPVNPFPGFLGGVHGSILYRSAVGWVWLAPGTAGQLLTTQGEGANPTWETDLARSTFTWWSEPQEVVTLTTSSAVKSLPNVVVGDFPTGATAVRVIAVMKFRQVEETSGTLNVVDTLYLGDDLGSNGEYNLSDGTINATYEKIGNEGNGIFTQTGGTNKVSNTFYVSDDGTSRGS